MMFRLQFTIDLGEAGCALAWPSERMQNLTLASDPWETILYGSEALAVEDCTLWFDAFPKLILAAEVITIPLEGDGHACS